MTNDTQTDEATRLRAGTIQMPGYELFCNAAKYRMHGEFSEGFPVQCPECDGDGVTVYCYEGKGDSLDSGEFTCRQCDGSGQLTEQVTVSWTTIKAIYKRATELFAPQPTGRTDSERLDWLEQNKCDVIERSGLWEIIPASWSRYAANPLRTAIDGAITCVPKRQKRGKTADIITITAPTSFARGAIVRDCGKGENMLVVRDLGRTVVVVRTEGDGDGQLRMREIPKVGLIQVLGRDAAMDSAKGGE